MDMRKWVSFKPIGYAGMALALIGLFAPRLLGIEDSLLRWIGLLVAVLGFYLIFKGREEHNL